MNNNNNNLKHKIHNHKLEEKVIDNMMTIKEEDIRSIIIIIIMKGETMGIEIDHIEEINHIIDHQDKNGKRRQEETTLNKNKTNNNPRLMLMKRKDLSLLVISKL